MNQIIIHGVFFQEQAWLEVAQKHGVGEAIKFLAAQCQDVYHGIIAPESPNSKKIVGVSCDRCGVAELSQVMLTETHFSFNKKYDHRRDVIEYVFPVKEGNMWIGTYTGLATGSGLSACVLSEVPDAFFDPNYLAARLAKL